MEIPARLTKREMRLLEGALRSPALWAFAVVAGEMGLHGAIQACETGEITDAALARLTEGRWTTKHLPPREKAEQVILAVVIKARMRKGRCIEEIAGKLGATRLEAMHALGVYDRMVGTIGRCLDRMSQDRSRHADGSADTK